MSIAETRLTASEFAQLPPTDKVRELVRGKVVEMNPPGFRHGVVSGRAHRFIGGFVDENDCGRCTINDAGIITQRDPDSVRGADLAYYSYATLPRDQEPAGYPVVAPDLVVEVRSPNDRWASVLEKIAEYLNAGVRVVLALDPQSRTVRIYRPDTPEQSLSAENTLTLDDVLPYFNIKVKRFFA